MPLHVVPLQEDVEVCRHQRAGLLPRTAALTVTVIGEAHGTAPSAWA